MSSRSKLYTFTCTECKQEIDTYNWYRYPDGLDMCEKCRKEVTGNYPKITGIFDFKYYEDLAESRKKK